MIVYKSREEIEEIRLSNQIVDRIIEELKYLTRMGVESKEMDDYEENR